MHHNRAWYSLKPVPLNQNDCDELMQVLSVWRRFDMKKFKSNIGMLSKYQLSCQMEDFKHLLADFDKAEKEFVEWKFSRESSQLISSTPNDQENSYLAGLYMYQRKNLAERLKISESICEQFINLFNDLPNPTPCLKRFKEGLDMTSSVSDQNQEPLQVQYKDKTNHQFRENNLYDPFYQQSRPRAPETADTEVAEPETQPDIICLDDLATHSADSTIISFHNNTRVFNNSYSSGDLSDRNKNNNQIDQISTSLLLKFIETANVTSSSATSAQSNCSCELCKGLEETNLKSGTSQVKVNQNEIININELVQKAEQLRIRIGLSARAVGRNAGLPPTAIHIIMNYPRPWEELNDLRKDQYRSLNDWFLRNEHKPSKAVLRKSRKQHSKMFVSNTAEVACKVMHLLGEYGIPQDVFVDKKLLTTMATFERLASTLHSPQRSELTKSERRIVLRLRRWSKASREEFINFKLYANMTISRREYDKLNSGKTSSLI